MAGSQLMADDNLLAITVDNSGNAMYGRNFGGQFSDPGRCADDKRGLRDVVVAKLDASGSSLLFSNLHWW